MLSHTSAEPIWVELCAVLKKVIFVLFCFGITQNIIKFPNNEDYQNSGGKLASSSAKEYERPGH